MLRVEERTEAGSEGVKEAAPASSGGKGRLQQPNLHATIAWPVMLLLMLAGQFLPRGANAYLRAAGLLALALAMVFVFPPFYLLWKHGRREDSENYMETGAVVDRGPYAIVRHPQYLGYMLLSSGFALLSQHRLVSGLSIMALSSLYLQALAEEEYCLAQLGEPYEHYLHRVPRFNMVRGIMRVLRRAKARRESAARP
jgi:protein-S-isoprenylcysteine O-methyltransferase Ste14